MKKSAFDEEMVECHFEGTIIPVPKKVFFEILLHVRLDGRKFVGMDRLIARVEKREGTTFENEIASAEEMYSLLSSRGIDIAAERKKMLRHKKMVRLFKQCIPGFLSAPVLRLIAKYYKAL